MTTERLRLEERRDLVVRDIEELDQQVEGGEIDVATAQDLRSAYQRELESLEAAIERLPASAPELTVGSISRRDQAPRARSPRTVLISSIVIVVALSAAIALAARDTSPNGIDQATGPGALTVDPASVSSEELEAVVAANPNINGMRMALADRYFAAEDYGSALDHYLYIAENNPTADEESKVLARIGWMAYITDQPEAAEDYVLASLRVDPANAEATLYLGFITMYGLGDAEGAIPQLEAALELPNLSPSVVSQVEAALQEARQGGTP
jgi:tetratricopeptide (TPR) repeat protein